MLHVFSDGLWASIKGLYDFERWSGNELVLSAHRPASADFLTVIVVTDFSDNAKRVVQLSFNWFPSYSHYVAHAYLRSVRGAHAHGCMVIEERLLGSVTQNVLYHASSNVLLVPYRY